MPAFLQITNANIHDSQISKYLLLKPAQSLLWIADTLITHSFTYVKSRKWAWCRVWGTMPSIKLFLTTMQRRFCLGRRGISKGMGELPQILRCVVVRNEQNDEELALLVNDFQFSVATIADMYKDRREFELFFKTLKQNLKVKTLAGTSDNVLHIHLWTVLISL